MNHNSQRPTPNQFKRISFDPLHDDLEDYLSVLLKRGTCMDGLFNCHKITLLQSQYLMAWSLFQLYFFPCRNYPNLTIHSLSLSLSWNANYIDVICNSNFNKSLKVENSLFDVQSNLMNALKFDFVLKTPFRQNVTKMMV